MEAYDEETEEEAEEGKADLIYGRLEHMLDNASQISGLTQKQYRDWGKIECMDTNTRNSRGRSLSKRRKGRMEITERSDRESSANRGYRQREADEERKRRKHKTKGK